MVGTSLSATRMRLAGLLGQAHVRSMITNSGWLVFERLYRMGMSVIVTAWVARYLGPDRLAGIAYSLAVIGLFLPIAQLGMSNVIVKDIVQRPDDSPTIIGTTLSARLLGGCVAWLGAMLFAWVANPSDSGSLLLTALIGGQLLFQASDTFDLWFQANARNRLSVVSRLCATTLTNAIKVGLLLAKAPVWAFALMLAVDTALVGVALVLTYRTFPAKGKLRASWAEARTLLEQTWPFIFTGLSIAVYMRIDQIMLKSLSNPHELGLFAATTQFSQVWQMVPMTLSTSLAPFLARKAQEGEHAFLVALRYVMLLLGGSMLIASIATAIAAPWIIHLFLGPAYADSAPVLAISVFTNVFIGLGVGWSMWVVVARKSKLSIVSTLIGSIVSVVGNFLLLPRFGAVGAAIVAVAAQAIASLLINAVLTPRIFLLQLGIMPRSTATAPAF